MIIFFIREEPLQRNAILVKPKGTGYLWLEMQLTTQAAWDSHRLGQGGKENRARTPALRLPTGRQLPFELRLLQVSCREGAGSANGCNEPRLPGRPERASSTIAQSFKRRTRKTLGKGNTLGPLGGAQEMGSSPGIKG